MHDIITLSSSVNTSFLLYGGFKLSVSINLLWYGEKRPLSIIFFSQPRVGSYCALHATLPDIRLRPPVSSRFLPPPFCFVISCSVGITCFFPSEGTFRQWLAHSPLVKVVGVEVYFVAFGLAWVVAFYKRIFRLGVSLAHHRDPSAHPSFDKEVHVNSC